MSLQMTDEEFRAGLERLAQERRARSEERGRELERRTHALLHDLATHHKGSELFRSLLESYAESDPEFRARMESQRLTG